MQDHDVYKKRLQADGTPIDEGIKHTIGPENLDLMSKDNVDENGTVCGSCYGAHTPTQLCCNTCDEVIVVSTTQDRTMLRFGSQSCQQINTPTATLSQAFTY